MDKAKAGQRNIKAADWNQIRDFINNFTPQNGGMVKSEYNPFLVTVKNKVSGVDLEPFQVVRVNSAMYPSRSADDTVTAALNGSIELDASAPTGEDGENIAIVQSDIANGDIGSAICSGATLCYVNVANANTDYKFAKSKAGETDYLEADEDGGQARIIWKQPGTGKKLAYVILDQTGTPTPEYFVINKGWNGSGTPPNTPSIFTAGSLHYVTYDGADWIPHVDNEATSSNVTRPNGARLVVCQEDAPAGAKDYKMPYYTPESNMGVPPTVTSYAQIPGAQYRAGVAPGEHTFTGSRWDYALTCYGKYDSGSPAVYTYAYSPRFLAAMQAEGVSAGMVYVEYNNIQIPVAMPSGSNLSRGDFPDVYYGDELLIEIDANTLTANGIDYPRDCQVGDLIVTYGAAPGRGWDLYSGTPQTVIDAGLTIYVKVKTNALL